MQPFLGQKRPFRPKKGCSSRIDNSLIICMLMKKTNIFVLFYLSEVFGLPIYQLSSLPLHRLIQPHINQGKRTS